MVNRVTTSLSLPEKPIRDYPRTRKQLRSASCALTMRTLLALFVTAASFALAFPSTTEYATNATDTTSEYRVTFSHNCLASAVFLHFLFTNGNTCATQKSSTNLARKVKSRNTFPSTMQKVSAIGPFGSTIKPIALDTGSEVWLRPPANWIWANATWTLATSKE
jgi:hypothetical protein